MDWKIIPASGENFAVFEYPSALSSAAFNKIDKGRKPKTDIGKLLVQTEAIFKAAKQQFKDPPQNARRPKDVEKYVKAMNGFLNSAQFKSLKAALTQVSLQAKTAEGNLGLMDKKIKKALKDIKASADAHAAALDRRTLMLRIGAYADELEVKLKEQIVGQMSAIIKNFKLLTKKRHNRLAPAVAGLKTWDDDAVGDAANEQAGPVGNAIFNASRDMTTPLGNLNRALAKGIDVPGLEPADKLLSQKTFKTLVPLRERRGGGDAGEGKNKGGGQQAREAGRSVHEGLRHDLQEASERLTPGFPAVFLHPWRVFLSCACRF